MSTSLSEQLNRLAAPQTTILTDTRRRASILFDPKDAATKNRKTIYELGISGLQELIAINSCFQQFEQTLFDESTLQLERSMESSEVNRLIDRNLRKFMQHLSPYLMLRPAHLCIEWLLRRFQVHEYNKLIFLALILPYHETNIFVKCLQTIAIKPTDEQLNWLKVLQKPGLPLSKSTILNRAATSAAFLQFVCHSTLDAIKELGTRAHVLQTQINFYASVVVGALEHASPSVQEWHITTILESLLKGLSSEIIDFRSAAYIVASQLVAQTQLTHDLLNAIIAKVAAVHFEQLQTATTLLLIWIFDTQAEMRPQFTMQTLLTLIQQKWLTGVISTLAKEGVAVHHLCVPLMRGAVQAIQQKIYGCDLFELFLERLLMDVEFPVVTAQEIISCFLDSYISNSKTSSSTEPEKKHDSNVIELDSDDDMPEVSEEFQAWYSDYLKKLERQYPTAFDSAIKDALQSNTKANSGRSKALKIAISYRLKSFDKNATDIYENLYHHTAKIRLHAIQTLLQNLNKYKSKTQNYELLKECLADRIKDDSEQVVTEVLKLSTEALVDILGYSQLVEQLFSILFKAQTNHEKWSKLMPLVVQHLTTQLIVDNYDTNLILLALMPLLFPSASSKEAYQHINVILKSALTNKVTFLQALKDIETIRGDSSEFSATIFKRKFLDIISHSKQTPTAMALFQSVKDQQHSDYFKLATHFSHFLLLATAFLKETITASESMSMLTRVRDYCKHFKLKHIENQEWQQINKHNCIPLQLFADFLNTLTRKTKFNVEQLQNWQQPSAELECLLQLLHLISEQAFSHESAQEKLEWTKALRELFNTVFAKTQSKLEFLSNFYIYEELAIVPQYALLRLRAFKLLNAMLQNTKQNKFVLSTENVFKICVALSSQHETMRMQALVTLQCMLNAPKALNATLREFVERVLERSNEIGMDHEQFPLVLFTILKPTQSKPKKAHVGALVLTQLIKKLGGAQADLQDAVFKAETLKLIKHVNDEHILAELLKLALLALDKYSQSDSVDGVKLLLEPYSSIYQLICERFDSQTIENVLVDQPLAWQLFEKIFHSYDVFLAHQGKLLPVPCLLLETLDEAAYERMPANFQVNFIKLLIKTVALAENDTIFLAANKLLKRCELNCESLVPLLQAMFKTHSSVSSVPQRKSTQASQAPQLQIHTLEWKQGVVLLELLENKKKLVDAAQIIPALFELLKRCLEMEEQSAVEYVKQLSLSALLHCSQRAKLDGIDLQTALPKSTFRIDQIVQCVRATQNPQTHHNALLLLSHCAGLFPQQVLLNIVDIFTFMGSTVVRHDDAFSFHIINNIIESIVPILVQGGSSSQCSSVVPVLKVFSDIMLDVPEHRRLPLYTKLLNTLQSEQYLWMFLCVVFEALVVDDEKQRLLQKKSQRSAAEYASDKLSARMEFALKLTSAFPVTVAFQTCIELMNYISTLPHSKETVAAVHKPKPLLAGQGERAETSLFDVQSRSAKQLRHYKYVIMQFLSTFTGSAEFLRQIAACSDEELLAMKPYYQNFIIKTLSYAPVVNVAIEKAEESSQIKFWKVISHHLYDVLDNAISLLSPDMFLVVVQGLMQHQLNSIRKKVIELLINKLQQRDNFFDAVDEQRFKNLLQPLSDIVDSIMQKNESGTSTASSNECVFIQQTALIAIKLLSKLFALKHVEDFKNILANLTQITKKHTKISKIVFATVILTMIEISSNLKVHSLAQLPKFMPQLMDVLADQASFVRHNAPDNVSLAIITGMQKLFESLPLFLAPYIVDIITHLSSISTCIELQLATQTKDLRTTNTMHKITAIWTKIAAEIPVRILVPSCEKAYNNLMASKYYSDIGVLMKLLLQSIANTNNTDLATVQSELCDFFMAALEFRTQMASVDSKSEVAKATATELCIINAFVAWVLKLSESSFRPIYYKLYEWALKGEARNEAILTYFLLTNKIAESLKSLFVLFARDFIDDAAALLNKHNSSKQDILQESEFVCIELLKAILSTLHNVFLYDSKGFIDTQRFETLMQPIVDQLENRLVLENVDLQQELTSCIAQLAVTVSNDIMWKQLNQQVLLKTRTNVPEVRIHSFNCCVEIARKLGDDFTSLLPETVPFIAELFEDENPRVEQNTRKSVQELESILGESLQKYL